MTTLAMRHAAAPARTKKDAIIYWATTGIISAVMLVSAAFFGLSPAAKGAFAHLGFPDYFRIELTVAKLLGGLALLIPAVPTRIKEFAYVGCSITISSAVIAHAASGDSVSHIVDPTIMLCILIVSYISF